MPRYNSVALDSSSVDSRRLPAIAAAKTAACHCGLPTDLGDRASTNATKESSFPFGARKSLLLAEALLRLGQAKSVLMHLEAALVSSNQEVRNRAEYLIERLKTK